MTIFARKIEGKITERLFKNRAVLIFGPRQAGKTTLSKKFWNPLEIDLIEDKNGLLSAYECKWKNEEFSFNEFLKKYKEASVKIITFETILNDDKLF